jgi:hypothetical protein
VTSTPKAPHHSAFFGACHLTPDSINPKSEIRLNAAIERINIVKPMPIGPDECKNGTSNGVNSVKKIETKYSIIIAPTRLYMTLLNVGVGRINLDE